MDDTSYGCTMECGEAEKHMHFWAAVEASVVAGTRHQGGDRDVAQMLQAPNRRLHQAVERE